MAGAITSECCLGQIVARRVGDMGLGRARTARRRGDRGDRVREPDVGIGGRHATDDFGDQAIEGVVGVGGYDRTTGRVVDLDQPSEVVPFVVLAQPRGEPSLFVRAVGGARAGHRGRLGSVSLVEGRGRGGAAGGDRRTVGHGVPGIGAGGQSRRCRRSQSSIRVVAIGARSRGPGPDDRIGRGIGVARG